MSAADAPPRFWARVEKTETCWLWLGASSLNGYGRFSIAGRMFGAHRYAWTLLRGEIPEGLVIDHLCRVRHCVNPEHMEVVSPKVNTLRGLGPTAANALKTHCGRGHAYTPENTRVGPEGSRHCRTCRRMHTRNARAALSDMGRAS